MMDNDEAFENLKVAFTEEEFMDMCRASMEIYNKIESFSLERNSIIPEVKVKDYPKDIGIFHLMTEYPILRSLFVSDNIQERYWVN